MFKNGNCGIVGATCQNDSSSIYLLTKTFETFEVHDSNTFTFNDDFIRFRIFDNGFFK